VFRITTTGDQVEINNYALSIADTAPTAPNDGDCWLDTSEADTSIGNGTSAPGIPARGGFLFKTWISGEWQTIAGQGATGTRAAIPLPLQRQTTTYITLRAVCLEAHAPFELEGLGIAPGGGTPDA